MTVRAKFRCNSVKQIVGHDGKVGQIDVEFGAVADQSDDNKNWSKWTPAGHLQMMITNPECFDKFLPGKSYYLDITAVEAQ